MLSFKPRAELPCDPGPQGQGLAERTDDELMRLTSDGMLLAFDVLVRRHQIRVMRMATRYLGDVALAKDVAQTAFLELYRNRERYEPRGKFVGYLCRIVINQCRMSVRSLRGARQALCHEVCVAELGLDGHALRERTRDLQHALGRLSEKLRVVVVLRYGADLDLREIADALDLPLGTVKRRLFDAMAKLRDMLEQP